MSKVKVAIIGSGNIGSDLMMKVLKLSSALELCALAGIDPESDGLQRADKLGISVTAEGIDGLVKMADFPEIDIVFDATSAAAHNKHNEVLQSHGKRVIDLTPSGIGPYTIPSVNADANLDAPNVSMVTCGAQATIPIIAAVNRVTPVHYGEIVASIASKSAGPGTRANIDEFTQTTSHAIETVGGARFGKAIIVLNPAEPPLIMRDTVYCLTDLVDQQAIITSIEAMVEEVHKYVPGYRLKQAVQFEEFGSATSFRIPGMEGEEGEFSGTKISVFLEVEGAAHYLPAYAGNLDIMTSAALRTAEKIALRIQEGVAA
jgi:acetaldehyde dehydrogenase